MSHQLLPQKILRPILFGTHVMYSNDFAFFSLSIFKKLSSFLAGVRLLYIVLFFVPFHNDTLYSNKNYILHDWILLNSSSL